MRSYLKAAALLLFALPALGKTLHWSAIDVNARLDKEGNLRVVERQQMVFDGDWNGGERDFGLRPRQRVDIDRIVRIDEGQEIPLERGDLASVDRWDFAQNGVVRWRSRLPQDPPFANEELTYVLHYTYTNVVQPGDDERTFRLDHDFGMPQRAGVVERFTLRVEFDPVWGDVAPVTIERTNLPPGAGVIVTRELTWRGAGHPAAVDRVVPAWVPLAVLAFFGAGLAALIVAFVIGERATGRFEPVVTQFDRAILDLHAEVAGAAWDAGVGAPEVAATLARMSQEGKLTTRVEGKTLHLTLNVNRDSLPGHEELLVKALFSTGSEETSTDIVKERYRSSGFDPATIIRPGIEAKLAKIPGWKEKAKRYRLGIDLILLAVGVVLVVAAALPSQVDLVTGIIGVATSGFFGIFALIAAKHFSRAITGFVGAVTMAVLILLVCAPLVVITMIARPLALHAPVLAALAIWTLSLLKLVLDLLKITDPPAKIAFRKRIAGARQFFTEQLQLPQPSLRDEWFPYLLAFGLGKNVDRWFRSFGGDTYTASTTSWSSSSSSSSSSSGSSWTGGGGAFGGAGATGTWAIAAGAMAAGVSAPSSSSSGGGGGGGGSSSGGGGGGGW